MVLHLVGRRLASARLLNFSMDALMLDVSHRRPPMNVDEGDEVAVDVVEFGADDETGGDEESKVPF